MTRHFLSLALLCAAGLAQTNRYNYDESKVPPYKVPDPLVMNNGETVKDARTWTEERRPELMAIFASQVYGNTPAETLEVRTGPVVVDRKALGGKAIRKQVTIYFSARNNGPRMHILLYLPASAPDPSPVFVGLNFNGNQSVAADPGILTHNMWVKDPAGGDKMLFVPPDDRTRGANAANWQVEKLIAHGYALATVCYGDIEGDFDGGAQTGVRSLFPHPEQWSALGAWAWGLSRVVDYLRTERRINPLRIALIGHSRLGKAALWAAAQDPRFTLVVSNESGKGGASLLKRGYGETIDHLNTSFPWWFGPEYKQYNGHPEKLPIDGNELLALIAPRPLYVASAEGDQGSDPKGEFLSAAAVGRVYQLFGKKGLGADRMPAVNQPIMHDVGYHMRDGRHDVTAFDWDQYIAFADLHWGAPPQADPPK